MNYVDNLKQRLNENALKICAKFPNEFSGKEFPSAFVWNNIEMNFHKKTMENISKNTDWIERTKKKHSQVENTFEMQSSNSSDALLMNIFCFPKILKWKGVIDLLGIDIENGIEFGKKFHEEGQYMAEIDMKIGNSIFEAKLTETDFTEETVEKINHYKDFGLVFDKNLLLKTKSQESYLNYQLIRNILVAYYNNFSFTLLCDETRIDLIKSLFEVTTAIKIDNLRRRVSFVTWQEITNVCGKELKDYITEKYF